MTPEQGTPTAPAKDFQQALLGSLSRTPTTATLDVTVRALFAGTDWEVLGYRFVSGSHYSDVRAAATERIVAARAGHLYLARERGTGAWATLWVSWCLRVENDVRLWDRSDVAARADWLRTIVVDHSTAATTLGGLVDIHSDQLSAFPYEGHQVYDAHFTACSTILSVQHGDADAVLMLSGLGAWDDHGLRQNMTQPLLGRIRDVEFASLCGTRPQRLKAVVSQYLAESGVAEDRVAAVGLQWTTRLTQCSMFERLPPVAAPFEDDQFDDRVRAWCASQTI